MISSPLILAAIYTRSPDGVYFFSSITAVISTIIMITLSCRKDAKTLGKTSEATPTSIELPVVNEKPQQQESVNNPENQAESKSEVEMNVSGGNEEVSMNSPIPEKSIDLATPTEQVATTTVIEVKALIV